MRDLIRKPKNWIGFLITIIFLFALIYSFVTSMNANLPSYTEPEATPTPTTTIPDISTTEYMNEETGLTMLVPSEWQKIVKSGHDTFINQVDGAMIVFDVGPYDPTLNAVTMDTVSNDIYAANGVLGTFVKNDTHSYLTAYEIGSMDYFEYNVWDLEHTIRISMQIPTQRYSYYYDIMVYLFDSIKWEQQYPIPEDFILYYSDYGNFEFGVPVEWQYGIVDGVFNALSPNGSLLTCTLTSSSLDLSSVDQISYVEFASAGKSNFLLSNFSNTGTNLVAEASFTQNGQTFREVRSMYANGIFQYEFLFQCPTEFYETDGAYFLTAMNLFRVFS